jgi:hypothetical protein
VIETLADVMLVRGIPEHIRSDNGPEFIAEELRSQMSRNPGPTRVRRCGSRTPTASASLDPTGLVVFESFKVA